jgi:3-phenylpropionate/cinnamic acid dioxygenase small subunit
MGYAMTLVDETTSVSAAHYFEIAQFLGREAALLDENKLWDWFALLADDFDYVVPIRVTKPRDTGGEQVEGSHRARDTKGSIKYRIDRLYTGHAWAEDPASRTCRVVGSIVVQGEVAPGEFEVSNSLMLYRERGRLPDHDLICGQRQDVIRLSAEGPRLVKRTVNLAHTILNTPNLGLFL